MLTADRFSGCNVPAHPELVFPPHFLLIVVEVKALGPPHVSLFVSVEFHCHKVEVNLATMSFEDISRFKTVISVCL